MIYSKLKIKLTVVIYLLLSFNNSNAVLPVIDAADVAQTTITAIEEVKHTLKQIEQYKTQLDQFKTELQNTVAPAAYIWDQANQTMNQLRIAVDTLQYYKKKYSSTDAYLREFKNTAAYRSMPCYQIAGSGCNSDAWKKLMDVKDLGNESQKKATDSLFIALDQQNQAMEADAAKLVKLQALSQSSVGRMEALGVANQLASHSGNQLLQIRALLIAQQNVIATRQQASADQEALQQAAREKFYSAPPPSNRAANKAF